MNPILIFKFITVPLLLWLMYAVSERFGRKTGSILAGLPLVMGPISVFITLEQGPAFGAQTALNVLPGICGYTVFCFTLARCIKHFGLPVSFASASIAYFVSGLAFSLFTVSIWIIVVVTFLLPYLVIRFLPKVSTESKPQKTCATKPPVMQMTLGAVLVIVETGIASFLGPVLSGIVIFFPVLGGVAAIFAFKEKGADALTHVVTGALTGLSGSTAFAITAAFALCAMPTLEAYALAIAMTMLTSEIARRLQAYFL